MKYKLFIPVIFSIIVGGCSSTIEMKTSSAQISQSRVNMIVDNQTTRTDLIAMFGKPNGIGQMGQSMLMNNPNPEIMTYSDCTMGGRGTGGFWSGKASSSEKCKVLSAMIDSKNIVITHKYFDNYLITEDMVNSIKPKSSSKKDVIKKLAGPTSIIQSGEEIIFIYKKCRQKTQLSTFMNMKQSQSCQQASVVMDKNSDIVKKVMFTPFM